MPKDNECFTVFLMALQCKFRVKTLLGYKKKIISSTYILTSDIVPMDLGTAFHDLVQYKLDQLGVYAANRERRLWSPTSGGRPALGASTHDPSHRRPVHWHLICALVVRGNVVMLMVMEWLMKLSEGKIKKTK